MLGQQQRNKCSNVYYRQCIIHLLQYQSCNFIVVTYSKQLEHIMGPYRKLTHFTERIISVEFWKTISTKNMAHLSFFIHILHVIQLITNSTSYTICQDLQWGAILIKNPCTISPAGQICMISAFSLSVCTSTSQWPWKKTVFNLYC